MALKTFRPFTPANRFKALPSFEEVTKKKKPEKSLTETKHKTGGRNNNGRITTRHIGGGHKQKYRIIDFKRSKRGIEAEVKAIEYDPNRTCRIALLEYTDGEKAYILAPAGLAAGNKVIAGDQVEAKVGNALPLKSVPLGTSLHNVELVAGRGGQIARSAGQQVILNNREAGYALVKLPSGEIRKIHEACYATVGQVGNVEHMNVSSGKAGRSRWQGIRPTVRGMVMNPIDHPNGGGQGKSKGGGGRHHPMSPWGQLAKGFKTRRKHKTSNNFIVERRKSKKK
jgi:large subunit ribosomal protein L2